MRSRRGTDPAPQEQDVQAYRGAVKDLQRSSYRNLRYAIANVCVFFGFAAALSSTTDDGQAVPMIVTIVGGLVAASTYFIKSWALVVFAAVVTACGVTLMAIAS
ncbi:hypothetical protein O7635_19660 [Asanoa sp. WMMD1127]|uniref:hypothetical protein n=1 Tax=Asanoa sp. WMMD1127 TaxID=3016107 RepID=UPI002417EF0D|nr:hypothetical protein [Asanoa sp. WMMD1127]MDG4824076.1 hypothetical protein [Asanoa sp. WMMD1127]